MLRNRIITALILAPLVVAAVFLLPPLGFAVAFWGVAALGAYEWAGLMGVDKPLSRVLCLVPFAVICLMIYGNESLYLPLLYLGWMFWGAALIAVLAYPRGAAVFRSPVVLAVLGIIVFTAAWVSLVVIRAHPDGAAWLVWMLLLVWGADVGAYFAGRGFGKHTLAPAVSPGKTWEGVLGGMLLPGLVCGAMLIAWQGASALWLTFMILLIAISVLGDLLESLVKRATGVKDSGTLLPGHGGMLDRIDSILAVLPFFAVVLY